MQAKQSKAMQATQSNAKQRFTPPKQTLITQTTTRKHSKAKQCKQCTAKPNNAKQPKQFIILRKAKQSKASHFLLVLLLLKAT